MPKEHWTQRLKRENKELKAENADLKKAAADTGRGNPNALPSDGLIITLTDKGVNDIREAHNAQSFDPSMNLAILADDEVEIRVYSRKDIDTYLPLTESQGIVDHVNPPPSWNQATEYTQAWLDRHNNLEGMRITVFDPYGFMEQFEGLNIVRTHIVHEYWRTEEGLRALEDADTQRQLDEFDRESAATPTFWTAILPLHRTQLDGRPVSALLAEAMAKGSPHPARLMQRVKDAFHVEYLDGEISEYPICGFQFEGEAGEPPRNLNIDFACDRGQSIRVNFHGGQLPSRIRKQFYRRDPNDNAVFSSTRDTGGASIEFVSEAA